MKYLSNQNSLLKLVAILASLAVMHVKSDRLDEPPTSGKFFYIQLYEQDYLLSALTTVGNSTPNHAPQVLPLFPTTQEYTLGIFSIFCTLQEEDRMCDVPHFYNHNNDNGENRKTKGRIATERVYLYQDGGIQQNDMQGYEISTDINFTVPEFLRETLLDDIYMLSIQQLEKRYQSNKMGGYLGLGPYTGIDILASNHLTHDEVLLYELKEKKHIDHQTVAVYVSNNPSEPSMLKFGSYDPEGFANPDDMGVFSTVNYNTWAVETSDMEFTLKKGDTKSTADFHEESFQTGNFLVDPGLPFFYVPAVYFQKLIQTMINGAITYEGAEFTDERIKFNSRCYEVNPGVTTDFRFKMTTHDGIDKEFFFELVDLLVDGSIFGEQNTCYVGIFKNTNAQHPSMTYAGVLFLKKYYTFFDMSGLDMTSFILGQRLRVGIGLRNPDNIILDKQYDHYYEGFGPNLHDQSIFTYEPNRFTYREEDDPNSPNYKGAQKSSTIVVVVVVFGTLILALLVGLFFLRYREHKKKQLGYLALTSFGDSMRPSEIGDSSTNIQDQLSEDRNDSITTAGDKQPIMAINQSSASLQVTQDI